MDNRIVQIQAQIRQMEESVKLINLDAQKKLNEFNLNHCRNWNLFYEWQELFDKSEKLYRDIDEKRTEILQICQGMRSPK